MEFGRGRKPINPLEALQRLQDSMVEDVLTMSDEAIRQEATEEGVDLAQSAEFVRGVVEQAIQSVGEGNAGKHSGKFANLDWEAIRTAAVDWADQRKRRLAEEAGRSNPAAATKRDDLEADR